MKSAGSGAHFRRLFFYICGTMKKVVGAVLLIFLVQVTWAQKNDTIYLNNGDRVTGELKKFEYGLLFLSTSAMETVNIEFDRIKTIYSEKLYEIRTSEGYRYFGSIMKAEEQGTVMIIVSGDTISKPLREIVQITSLKNSFLQKLDGSVSMGLSYTKASDVLQFNVNASVTYRAADIATRLYLNSIRTESSGDISQNNDAGLDVTYFFPGQWFAAFQAKSQENTELDLDSRIQAGIGGGYDIIRTNAQRLSVLAGLLANRERTIESATTSNNVELLIATQYKWFVYRQPKINITTGFSMFPSLTTGGRIRLEYDLTGSVEIVKDLFLAVTVYDSFDNNPTSASSSKNDWSVITSLGYSF